MSKIGQITQLELENFAELVKGAEDGTTDQPLSAEDVRARNLEARQTLSAAEVRQRDMAAHQVLKDKLEDGEIPTWAETYHRLLNAGFPWRVAAYVAWATMPKEYRWPKTQNDLALQVLGLTSDRAIATWRRKYPAIDQMIADLQAEALMEYRPGAFHALGTMASDTSYRANPDRRLFFEMTRDYTPRQKVTEEGRSVSDLSEYTDAELEQMSGDDAKEMLKRIRDEELPVEIDAGDDDA